MESSTSMDSSARLCNGAIVQGCDSAEEPENLDVDIVRNLDMYFKDIEDKLIVSRNVSDWVARGAISAVEQDAMEKIAQKDLELKRLKESLPLYHVGLDGNESMSYSVKYDDPRSRACNFRFTNSNGVVDHDNLPDSLEDFKFAAKEQLKKLKKEMDKIKGSTKSVDVDKALDCLKTILEDICIQSEDVICSSESLLSDRQQEMEFESEIERSVIKNCIRSLQKEFEQRLWDHNSECYGNENANWLDTVKEISILRQELSAIAKLFSFPESGQLLSHGSLEYRNGSGDHFSSVPIWEENGDHDESTVISIPETLEHVQLKDMTMESLFNYFKAAMTKMKRHHELQLQSKTEKYFSLKRELYIKESSSSLHLKKDKELDSFKKKIPDAILRLDHILTDIQKLPQFSIHGSSLDNLKDRLESLCLENQQLRDSLMDKKKEINCLQSQASDALLQISRHSSAEENLSKKVSDLEWIAEDAQIEASVSQDVYKFLVREVLSQMEGLTEESMMEYDMMRTIYVNMLKEASENAAIVNKLEIEDSVMESIIMQDICASVFGESFKEVEGKVAIWNEKYLDEKQVRVALEMQVLEKENSLKVTLAEKEKIEQENVLSKGIVDEKAKLLLEKEEELVKGKEKFVLASQEIDKLRVHSAQQDELIAKYDEELHVVKNNLAKALEKVETDRMQISQLGEQLETVMQNLREANEEKIILKSRSQNYQNALSLVEAREAENLKQMKSIICLVQELLKAMTAFEFRTVEDIKMNSLRIGNLSTQFGSLIQKANMLKKTGLQYKQKLEKSSCDLQKAEAEVDLLGDEVDALLSLLEKIYIALDHYSAILQHYPGIMEILKLVRRELSGESTKSV